MKFQQRRSTQHSQRLAQSSVVLLSYDNACKHKYAIDLLFSRHLQCGVRLASNRTVKQSISGDSSIANNSDAKYLTTKVPKYVLKYFLGTYLLVL